MKSARERLVYQGILGPSFDVGPRIMRLFDPELDLSLSRAIRVDVDRLWATLTDAGHLKAWFVPRPWSLGECELEATPGGRFNSVIVGPDGERFPAEGCVLWVESGRRFAWTSALREGFRPVAARPDAMPFTADWSLEPSGTGTQLEITVRHADVAGRLQHEAMGFEAGWSQMLDQWEEYSQTL